MKTKNVVAQCFQKRECIIPPFEYLIIKSKHLGRNNARINSKTKAIVTGIMTVVVLCVIVRLLT